MDKLLAEIVGIFDNIEEDDYWDISWFKGEVEEVLNSQTKDVPHSSVGWVECDCLACKNNRRLVTKRLIGEFYAQYPEVEGMDNELVNILDIYDWLEKEGN